MQITKLHLHLPAASGSKTSETGGNAKGITTPSPTGKPSGSQSVSDVVGEYGSQLRHVDEVRSDRVEAAAAKVRNGEFLTRAAAQSAAESILSEG